MSHTFKSSCNGSKIQVARVLADAQALGVQQQAARVSDETGFMYLGELIEFGPTAQIFTRPRNEQTEDYITGKYG